MTPFRARAVLAVLTCSTAAAQSTHASGARGMHDTVSAPGSAVVMGTVYDSISHTTLAGALVQLALGTGTGRVFSATTDSSGAFRLDGLPAGLYRATFFHPVLDSLGLSLIERSVRVARDTTLRLSLAVPSPRTIWTASCHPATAADSSGLLLGRMRNADDDTPVAGGVVAVMWYQLVLDKKGLHSEHRQRAVRSSDDGHFAVCGIPAEIAVGVYAEHGAAASGVVSIVVPARGILHRDLAIGVPDSTTIVATDTGSTPGASVQPRGTAHLAGTVRTASGDPVHGAQVAILGTTISASTTSAGTFELSGLVPGTHTVEVRMLGFEPEDATVDVTRHRTTSVSLTLDKPVAALQTVTVYGKPTMRDPNGFYERKKWGFGHFFTRADIERRSPFRVSDMFTALPGVRVYPVGAFDHRVLMDGGRCVPEFYIDGTRMSSLAGGDIDALLPANELGAIEVYRDALSTPPEYRSLSGCGTIVIWTSMAMP